jgi:hypothetical protein
MKIRSPLRGGLTSFYSAKVQGGRTAVDLILLWT